MSNLIVEHRELTKFEDGGIGRKAVESTVLSFNFNDGEGFNCEIHKDATKEDLLYTLLGVVELIKDDLEEVE